MLLQDANRYIQKGLHHFGGFRHGRMPVQIVSIDLGFFRRISHRLSKARVITLMTLLALFSRPVKLGLSLLVSVGGVIALSGCQSQPVVAKLPQPSFSAPVIATAPVTAPNSSNIRYTPQVNTTPAKPTYTAMSQPRASGRGWAPTTAPGPWRWIVLHHSATIEGGAARFNASHISKGWDSLGYHFVVGNGTDTRDGLIEPGPRWWSQSIGAHTKSPDNRFNTYGIGVCYVGNFDNDRPSSKQMSESARLVAWLMKTYNIPPDRVLGHRDTGRATDCPGNNFRIATIRKMATDILAAEGTPIPTGPKLTSGEMLVSQTPPAPKPAAKAAPTRRTPPRTATSTTNKKAPAKAAPQKSSR
jgi:hypothetical protein